MEYVIIRRWTQRLEGVRDDEPMWELIEEAPSLEAAAGLIGAYMQKRYPEREKNIQFIVYRQCAPVTYAPSPV